MILNPPIRYTADVEQFQDDEAETIEGLNETFQSINDTTSEDYGQAVRAVHAKGHALIEGTLTIDGNLPPELAQGVFAAPGEHAVVMRMSTNAGDILDDSIALPRGLALKILSADGARLAGAEGDTQDLILINGKTFQAKTADKFLGNLKLLAKTTDKAEGAKKVLSTVLGGINAALTAVGLPSPTLASLGGAPNVHSLGETFYSATPFRYGDYIAKFSIAPVSPDLTRFTGQIIDASDNPDAVRDTIAKDMTTTDAVWELRVQLCRDLEKMPVENPTVEWDEEASPFLRVGTIHAAPQPGWDADKEARIDKGMRFSVWTGVEAHRPLGNINRARKDTYNASAQFRAKFNGCPLHEPRVAESV